MNNRQFYQTETIMDNCMKNQRQRQTINANYQRLSRKNFFFDLPIKQIKPNSIANYQRSLEKTIAIPSIIELIDNQQSSKIVAKSCQHQKQLQYIKKNGQYIHQNCSKENNFQLKAKSIGLPAQRLQLLNQKTKVKLPSRQYNSQQRVLQNQFEINVKKFNNLRQIFNNYYNNPQDQESHNLSNNRNFAGQHQITVATISTRVNSEQFLLQNDSKQKKISIFPKINYSEGNEKVQSVDKQALNSQRLSEQKCNTYQIITQILQKPKKNFYKENSVQYNFLRNDKKEEIQFLQLFNELHIQK